jgi:hypothetical protein
MLNFLTGDSSLRRVRDRGRQFAQELYDPNVFAPQREMASRQATMGIDQGGIRSGALAQLSRVDNDADIFGGSAGRMVGMMGQQNLAQGRNITDMETRLGIADQQARLQGQQQLAEVQSRQLQTGAMRDAAMTEADMMYQAERSSRRQALAGTAIGLGTMGAMGMFPGLKDGALALINKLTGATGLPEGAAMSADVEPTSTGGFTGVSALDIINSTNMSQFGQTPDVEPTTPNSLDGMSFGQAFRTSRDQGLDRFTWRGRPFTTELATTADRVEDMMVDPEDDLNMLMGTDGFTGGTMDMPMQPAQRGRITYTAEGPEVLVTADRMQPTQPMDQAEAMSGYTSQVSPQTRQQAEDFFQRPLQQLSDNLMRESLSPDPFIENAQEAARGITYTGEGPELNVTGQRITEPRPDRVPEVDNGLAQSMQSALTAFSAGGRLDDQSINDLMLRYIQAGFDPAQVSLIIRALVPNLLDQSAVEGVRQSPQQRPQRPLQQLSDNLMRESLSPLFGN